MRTFFDLCVVVLFSTLVYSCGAPLQNSNLKHEDSPFTRNGGVGKSQPWHFHTGRGQMQNGVPCDLSPLQKSCFEVVYYFTSDEILSAVAAQTQVLSAQRNEGLAWTALMGPSAAQLGRFAYGATVAPEAGASKVTAVVSWIGAGVLGLGTAYSTKQTYDLQMKLNRISNAINSEELFVNRCGHVRSGFQKNLLEEGVTLNFPLNGGILVESKEYFESQREEKELFSRTLDWAVQNHKSSCEAYSAMYVQSCDQLPRVGRDVGFETLCSNHEEIPLTLEHKLKTMSEENPEFKTVKFTYEGANEKWSAEKLDRVLTFIEGFEDAFVRVLQTNDKDATFKPEIIFKETNDDATDVEKHEQGRHLWFYVKIPARVKLSEDEWKMEGKRAAFGLKTDFYSLKR